MEKDIQPIQPGTRKKLFQNTGALFISKISRVALDSSDSIIISATQLQGLSLNGKYSNYTLLVSLVNSFFSLISRAISASLGNFMAEESVRKSKDLLDRMYLVFTWLYGFCFICLWCLLNPFIGGVWITEEWLLSEQLVFLVSFNFLVNGMDFAPVRFIESAGLYWQAKSRWVISAVLNIFLSVLFGVTFGWGLEGVVLATAVAMLGMTCFDPYIIFKHLFHERPFCYYLRYMVSLAGIVLTGALTNAICSWLAPAYTLSSFILRLLICLVLPNLLWLAVLWRTKLFRDTFAMVLSYIRILIKKNI